MRVGIATDHGGFGLKEDLRGREFSQAQRHLRRLGKVAALETKTTSPLGGEAAAISA
jgi:hypothetical protein